MSRLGEGGTGTGASVPHDGSDDLGLALERVNLCDFVLPYLEQHSVQIRRGRFPAVWRGGKDDNCSIRTSKTKYQYVVDHVTNEFFGTWAWLTKVEKMSTRDAAQRVLHDAGMVSTPKSGKRRAKTYFRFAQKPVPDMPNDLRDAVKAWHKLGGVQLGLDGAKLETLQGFASWVAGALSAYKIELESIADGVTLEHCIDAFEGVSLRICACGKRWATRMALERDGVASVGFGCELCGLVWTIPELEKAHAARGKS